MRRLQTQVMAASAALVLMLGVAPLLAQDTKAPPPAQSQSQAQEAKTAQGQLMRVDSDARTLTIQSAQGTPMVFRYTEDTKVVGADKGVAGLATMNGAQVTVHFVQRDKDNIASEIEIRQKG
jgi:hypothetical protein